MKNIIFLFLVFCELISYESFSQTFRRIRGTITEEGTNLPVMAIKVFTDFNVTTTDALGRFELDLSSCKACTVGQRIALGTYNDDFGFFQKDVVIDRNLSIGTLSIPRNPNITGIMGIVKDVKTKKAIRNIKVRIGIDGNPNVRDEVKTDDFGMYNFRLRKDKVGNIKYVTIFFEDETGLHMPKHETKNIATHIETSLDPNESPAIEIEIKGYEKTQIKVYPGNLIRIKASGNIRLGSFVGSTDPDGIASGIAGFSLEGYNINRNIKHGALLYRITGDNDWKFSGKDIEFTAQKEGYIEFQVNDREQGNNSGLYKAKVIVIK
ncbi:hypothetical protein EXU85_03675 [Spirosoma sp. KCTC 42546]|uniref:hypothetical protein n=1 Tax=Spirosoma sp. KCTC 42546 TaxID=2520506 RepID=UPI00115A24BA|nr:hypothetical protein [Spirosoma sp. KCTC 42546]QDK77742.1 hypothetical protein EXU85_03675 [Spirosoma sp. KCTC 42546]